MKKALILAAIAALAFGSNASADIILLTSPGVVGIIDANAPDSASDANRLIWAQHLLDMGASATDSTFDPPKVFYTSSTDYFGTLSGGYKVDSGATTGFAGYTYLFAKYNGPNAGYVMWHIPTLGATSIPSQLGFAQWDSGQFGLSGWTAYGFVPDGGSVSMLLGAALLGLAGLRRFMK